MLAVGILLLRLPRLGLVENEPSTQALGRRDETTEFLARFIERRRFSGIGRKTAIRIECDALRPDKFRAGKPNRLNRVDRLQPLASYVHDSHTDPQMSW